MKLLALFKKPDPVAPTNPARELALIGARKRKAAARRPIRDKVDQMRAAMGMSPIQWGKL